MKEPNEKITMRENWQLNLRAFRIWYQHMPAMIWAIGISAVIGGVFPYVNIWFSARILDALSRGEAPEKVWRLVVITLVTDGVLSLVKAVANRWKEGITTYDLLYYTDGAIMHKKTGEMDFAVYEETETRDLRSKIFQNTQWDSKGLMKVQRYYESLLSAVIKVLSAVCLTVELFISKVPEASGKWTLLDHPIVSIIMAALMVVITSLASASRTKSEAYWYYDDENTRLGNRSFFYYYYEVKKQSRAMDMRIYDQYEICRENFKKMFTLSTNQFEKNAWGPMGLYSALGAALSVTFTGVIYVFVCLKARAGAFGIGSVTQYIASITALASGFAMLMTTLGQMKINVRFLRETFAYLDLPNVMYQGSITTEKRSDKKYEIEFRDVSFKYPGAENYALRHVNMKFQVGQRLAVVGENGSGKTTFIKLLCRLYDPTEGQILLDGIDIRKYKYEEYKAIFSAVFQDFQLLAYSLGENVAVKQQYDREKVLNALKKVGFEERLQTMEKGLDTCLYRDRDANGVQISGGEAQKIAMARALYKNAAFIILDEPTAALDPIAEYEVYTRFNDIVEDRTTIYISHRLASCRFCDNIAVFDKGCVIQQGNHDSLLEDVSGKYYALWHAQAQYYQVS